MGYLDIAQMQASPSLMSRVTAAAATEQNAGKLLTPDLPDVWASVHRWQVCAAPGWADAWASAEASDPGGDHGANEGVITDAMILSEVQAVIAG